MHYTMPTDLAPEHAVQKRGDHTAHPGARTLPKPSTLELAPDAIEDTDAHPIRQS